MAIHNLHSTSITSILRFHTLQLGVDDCANTTSKELSTFLNKWPLNLKGQISMRRLQMYHTIGHSLLPRLKCFFPILPKTLYWNSQSNTTNTPNFKWVFCSLLEIQVNWVDKYIKKIVTLFYYFTQDDIMENKGFTLCIQFQTMTLKQRYIVKMSTLFPRGIFTFIWFFLPWVTL